jgi:putative transposase
MIEFKGSHFERDVILWAVRWYVAYPISYRQLEEMMEEHGVEVDHATLNRWVLKYVPLLDQAFRGCKRPVGSSWRMDETYVRVRGTWKYLYRAVDKAGATVDFLLTAKRDRKAALRFLRKAIKWNGTPEKITIDKSGANTAAIESRNAERHTSIEIRQIKYLNNIVEQDHRAIKRLVRPMLGFKSFRSAAVTLAGIELMHMIRKGQLQTTGELCPAQQFYSLAGKACHCPWVSHVRPGNLRQNPTACWCGNSTALRAAHATCWQRLKSSTISGCALSASRIK